MKRTTVLSILVLVIIIQFGVASGSEIPGTMSYQGVLMTQEGGSVSNGAYELTFRLYKIAEGDSILWEETQTLDVEGSMFNATLGSVTPLDLDFHEAYELGVSINGEPELAPRSELSASPYAFRAAVADFAVTAGAASDSDWVVTDDDMHSGVPGNVGIGVPDPSHRLEVRGENEILGLVSPTNAGGQIIEAYRDSPAPHAFIHFKAGRGTKSSPSALQSGDQIARLRGGGYDGSGFTKAAEIAMMVDGDPGVDDMPGRIDFRTADDGSNELETRMTVKHNGLVGIGTTDPDYELDVHGDVEVTGTIYGTVDGGARRERFYVPVSGGATSFPIPAENCCQITIGSVGEDPAGREVGFLHVCESEQMIAFHGFDGTMGGEVCNTASLWATTTILTLCGGSIRLNTPGDGTWRLVVTSPVGVEGLCVW